MDTRTISEKYARIGNYLIDHVEELQHLANETIIYLSSTAEKKSKKRKVLGECEKVQEKNKWAIPCDFTITLFEPNMARLTDEQVAIVIYHELLHIGSDGISRWIKPHDLNDFKSIVDRFGTDWDIPGTAAKDAIAILAAEEGKQNERPEVIQNGGDVLE